MPTKSKDSKQDGSSLIKIVGGVCRKRLMELLFTLMIGKYREQGLWPDAFKS